MTQLANIIPPHRLDRLVDNWLDEDCPSFDWAALVVPADSMGVANLNCKQSCVLAGVPFFDAVFQRLSCNVSWRIHEGAVVYVEAGQVPEVIAEVTGPIRNILLGERVALNCLARTSGVATQVHKLVATARSEKWRGRVACTRKTTPGFKAVEKYGVLVGGGDPHRHDLSAMVMLKDNHLKAYPNVLEAVQALKRTMGFALKIEVEARNESEASEAVDAGADIVMLDNLKPTDMARIAATLKDKFSSRSFILEASGGINSSNFHEYLIPEIDVISMGCLTQGYPTIDFSLKLIG